MGLFKEKIAVDLKLVCGTCGKPAAGKARSNVTRFLFRESRCNCGKPEIREQAPVQIPLNRKDDAQTIEQLDDARRTAIEDVLGDRFELISFLGQGGMSSVYKVKDKILQKTFAFKVLNSDLVRDEQSVKRFEQEAKAAGALTHANLAAVYNCSLSKAGRPYIVMECLDGKTLADALRQEGSLSVPRALDIFIQACEAIAHAHGKGVVHRDIKPNNIMLEKGPEGTDFVKLVDFGIAKVLSHDTNVSQDLTRTGSIFGSPAYMSPEQCQGEALDGRSDIYSFGCVMYETLTGKTPFAAENPIKIIVKHITEDAKPISSLPKAQEVPRPLEAIIMHCLEKDPRNRYQSANQLLSDLEAVRDEKKIKIPKPKPRKSERIGSRIAKWIAPLILLVWMLGMTYVLYVTDPSKHRGYLPARIVPEPPVLPPLGSPPHAYLWRHLWVPSRHDLAHATHVTISDYQMTVIGNYKVSHSVKDYWTVLNDRNQGLNILIIDGRRTNPFFSELPHFTKTFAGIDFDTVETADEFIWYGYDGKQTIVLRGNDLPATWMAKSISKVH